MRHDQKVARFEQMLADRGHRQADAIPPMWRLLWKLGATTPPPYFLAFPIGALMAGLPFGLALGLIMTLLSALLPNFVGAMRPMTVLLSALIFGLLMAGLWRWESKKLRLPSWERV
jgi:Family of unknown function (DUF6404)